MRFFLFALVAALTLASGAVWAEPHIVYSKSFPKSSPEFVQIELTRDGQAVYKEAVDDDAPVKLKLKQEEVDEIYALADKLGHFDRTLESGLKVAFMGDKVFRWVDGEKVTEQKFNYSQDEDANKLLDWFEKITLSEQHYFMLERSVKFDKLGVHKAILQLEASYDRKRLLALDQFLPLLDRVAKNSSYLNMARERAAALAEVFRNPPPPKAEGAK